MKSLRVSLATLIVSVLAACGGGGGDGGDPALQGSVSGTVTKGPVSNATVAAYAIVGGRAASQVGIATTDANGNFTMTVGGHAGPMMLRVSGGSYTDEATLTAMPMAPGDVMTAAMAGFAAGAVVSGVQVTPVTAMAQVMADHLAGGMTDANIASANTAMGNYFSVSDILHIQPMNPLLPGSGATASPDGRNYGMTLAAMSQYAQMLGMSTSSAMMTALMADLEDGILNGMNGASQVSMPMGGMMGGRMMPPTAGTSGMAAAMTTFVNSRANASGMTEADMAALMQKLANASGRP